MENKTELLEVGKASYDALRHSRTLVKEGARLIDVAEGIESFLSKKGFEFSFPANISINDKAAHYTPQKDELLTFKADDLVKIDIGARKGTSLGDCAITIDLSGRNAKLIEASDEALESAISLVRAGRKVCEIGREIEKTAKKHGLSPIVNLGGHGISEDELHSGVFIPNYDNGDTTELEEGQVISIEPFITNGEGYVIESGEVQIYQKIGAASPRSKEARQIQESIDKNYLTYPFAMRWVARDVQGMSEFGIKRGISELLSLGCLEEFPVLVERRKGLVSQSEKELVVEKDSCILITE